MSQETIRRVLAVESRRRSKAGSRVGLSSVGFFASVSNVSRAVEPARHGLKGFMSKLHLESSVSDVRQIFTARKRAGSFDVFGYAVAIEGYEEWKYFVYVIAGKWYVCEVETGIAIREAADSKDAAVAAVVADLTESTPDQFRETLAAAVAQLDKGES